MECCVHRGHGNALSIASSPLGLSEVVGRKKELAHVGSRPVFMQCASKKIWLILSPHSDRE